MLSVGNNNSKEFNDRNLLGDVALKALKLKRFQKVNENKLSVQCRDILQLYSLFIFSPTNPLRLLTQHITNHRYFDNIILFIIMFNSIVLAIDNPTVDLSTDLANIVFWLNFVFTVLYTIEAVLKIIAQGFIFQSEAYLRSIWNGLDLLVVCSGWIDFIIGASGGLSALRVIRLFKVLRSITLIPGMQKQIRTIFSSIPSLLAVVVLFAFLFLLFGLVGMQLFSGLLHQKCYDNINNIYPEENQFCSTSRFGRSCPNNWICMNGGKNPNSGITSFDNIIISWLTILQIISLEGWSDIMYAIGEVTSKYSYLYFIVLILVGGFFCVNLVIAILVSNFEREANKERVQKALLQNRLSIQRREEQEAVHKTFHDCMLATCISPSISRIEEDDEEECLEEYLNNNENKNNNDENNQVTRVHTTPIGKRERNQIKRISKQQINGIHNMRNNNFFDKNNVNGNNVDNGNNVNGNNVDNGNNDNVDNVDNDVNDADDENVNDLKNNFHRNITIYDDRSTFHRNTTDRSTFHRNMTDDSSNFHRNMTDDSSNFHRNMTDDSSNFHRNMTDNSSNFHRNMTDNRSNDIQMTNVKKVFTAPPKLSTFESDNTTDSMFSLPELDDDQQYSCFRKYLRKIVVSKTFDGIILLIILVNTIILCIDRWNIDDETNRILEVLNLAFTIVFTFELIIKIIALGPRGYFSHKLNIFDFIIVLASWLELFFAGGSGVSALRAFRLLRILRIIESWESLHGLLNAFLKSLKNLIPFAGILVLFLYCFSILGLNLLANKMYTTDNEVSRSNFNSMPFAFITIFQIITGENWNQIMYDGIRGGGWSVSTFFVIVYALGNFLILNLFLATLMDNFTNYENQTEVQTSPSAATTTATSIAPLLSTMSTKSMVQRVRTLVSSKVTSFAGIFRTSTEVTDFEEESAWVQKLSTFWSDLVRQDLSLFLFSHDNTFRIIIARIVQSKIFERFIFLIILLSCTLLTIQRSNDNNIFQILNLMCTSIFILEMVLKSIAYGFFLHKRSYLRRDAFNIIDCCVVLIDILYLIFGSKSGSIFQVLRIIRSLRIISSLNGMKLTVQSLFRAIPGIFNLMLMMSLFILLFGLFGVQLFKGKLTRCSDLSNKNKNACIGTYQDPYLPSLTLDRQWVNPPQHFDNIGAALLTLFEVSTLEDWPTIMFLTIDSSPHDDAPIRDNHPEAALFFVTFIIFCNFFVLSMIIGVVYSEFRRVKQSQENTLFLTEQQRYWIELQRQMLFTKPRKVPTRNYPDSRWTLPFFKIATWPRFDQVMNILIILNALQMSVSYHNQPSKMTYVLNIMDIILTLVFVVEAMIKLIAFGIKQYFHSKWNQADFVIVVVTLAQLCLKEFGNFSSINVSFLRVFRVFRIFRFAKNFRPLKRLFQTLWLSMYALVNIGILLIILLYAYAVLGMHLFGNIRHGEYLNDYANFDNFINSWLVLYRMLSGENWNGIMHDCSVQPPFCDPNVNCGNTYAPLYFCSFIVIGNFVVLSLFITVILEQFSTMSKQDRFFVSHDDVELFARVWAGFSPSGSPFIPTSILPILLKELPPPLGMKRSVILGEKDVTSCEVLKRLMHLNIPDHNGYVHYLEVLFEVSKRALGTSAMINESCGPIKKLNRMARRIYPEIDDRNRFQRDDGPLMAASVYAAMLLQAHWRSRQSRKKTAMRNKTRTHHHKNSSLMVGSTRRKRKGTIGDRVAIRTHTNRLFLTLPESQRHKWLEVTY